MNKTILMGRLVKDPETRYTQSGKCVTQCTLAVNRPFVGKDGEKEADFIPVVLWGKPAEIFGNSVSKGQRVLVEGRLQIRQYTDKDGAKRYATEVISNSFEYIERKDGAKGGEPSAFDVFGDGVPDVDF